MGGRRSHLLSTWVNASAAASAAVVLFSHNDLPSEWDTHGNNKAAKLSRGNDTFNHFIC